jgi:hypothetical protein
MNDLLLQLAIIVAAEHFALAAVFSLRSSSRPTNGAAR